MAVTSQYYAMMTSLQNFTGFRNLELGTLSDVKSTGKHWLDFVFLTSRDNKANLRDLIAATGLVILLKLDSNRPFFSPCDLEIWCMTPKNNRAPLLCYFKRFASFRSHWWIQTGVTVRKRAIWVKIDFFSRVTLKFDGWPWKTIGHIS